MVKMKDLIKKSPEQLDKMAAELRIKIAETEKQKFSNDDKNYKKQRNQRRELARILTVRNQPASQTEKTEAKADSKKEDDK